VNPEKLKYSRGIWGFGNANCTN